MKGLFAKACLALAVELAAPAAALPSNNYVLHESRAPTLTGQATHLQYKRGNRLESDAIVPLRIALTQSNLDAAHDKLMSVSHPDSEEYGKHMSEEEVHALFAPATETADAVHSWLVEMGVDASKIRHYDNKGWLAIDLPASKAEELFNMEYHEHKRDGTIKIGTDQYYVPKHLAQHIDFIMPGVKLSAPMKRSLATIHSSKSQDNWAPKKVAPQKAKFHLPPVNPNIITELRSCTANFTVACYRFKYLVPAVNFAVPGNEAAVYESGDFYSQADLDSYYKMYTPHIPKGTHPKLQGVDGGIAPVPSDSPLNGGESDIDIDVIQSLIWPQTMILYQVDDLYVETQGENEGFLNTFLDALDGSYCKKKDFGIKGDSPGIDPAYPDPHPGGYKKPEMCGTYKPAHVVSISYGESELDVPKNYLQRQCNEFLKLGLQGTTVLVSSGDYGVGIGPGTDSCLNGTGQVDTIYNPGNPVACPYLTAVGATQFDSGTNILDAESSLQTDLGPGSELFASGGGFSNYFPVPSYQKSAVHDYFEQHDPGHPYYIANADASNIGENGGIYNRAGRGIPDISANGANFRAFANGTDYHWFGTSLAAPFWNAIITLINQERAIMGKKSVGFINPVLYSHTWALTDITKGSNPNCGTSGFAAVPGWDPVTGLGTPKYPALLGIWLGLP